MLLFSPLIKKNQFIQPINLADYGNYFALLFQNIINDLTVIRPLHRVQ